jgi:hypothetical protein
VNLNDQSTIDAFLKDPLSVDEKSLGDLFAGQPQEGVAVINAETELNAHLEAERLAQEQAETAAKAAEATGDKAQSETKADSQPAAAKTDESTKPDASATDDGSKTEGDKASDKDAVVLTKDGKRTIPYAVLEAERQRANALQARLTELNTKVAALEQQKETGTTDISPDVEEIDAETMRDLEENAPTLAKTVKSLQARISQLNNQLGGVIADKQQSTEKVVQEAIDSIPKIAYVQSTNTEAFNAIAGFDAILRSDPKFADLSLSKRFEKALGMYEAAHGQIELPESARQEDPTPPANDKAIDAAAKAAKAIAEAERKAEPSTLSDIPGGEPPSSGSLEDVANISAAALTAKFMNMTPDQISTYLARL